MSTDLLGAVKDQLTSSAISKISNFLGESTEKTQNAVQVAVPSLLAGLMEKASTTDGAVSILGTLNNGSNDGSLLNKLGDLFDSGDGIANLLSGGTPIIMSILGSKAAGIIDLISNVSGIKKSSSSSILNLVAPILMGVVGKQVSSQGLGLTGLTNLLMGQKQKVIEALPTGANGIFNFAGLGNFLGGTKSSNIKMHEDTEGAKSGGFNFWPWLLGAALLLGAWYFMKSCNKTNDMTGDASSTIQMNMDSLASSAQVITDSAVSTLSSVEELFSKKLSTGFEIIGANAGIENSLISFIEDDSKPVDKTTWFNFDNLLFDTGKSTIKAESKVQIINLAEILRAFPNVNLKIGGYTDNVGNEAANLKLSADRAMAVVESLKAIGIDGKRLEAEGYGSKYPVATNDTKEGQAMNRRIAARVTAK